MRDDTFKSLTHCEYFVYEVKSINNMGIISRSEFVSYTEEDAKKFTIHAQTRSLATAEWIVKGLKGAGTNIVDIINPNMY